MEKNLRGGFEEECGCCGCEESCSCCGSDEHEGPPGGCHPGGDPGFGGPGGPGVPMDHEEGVVRIMNGLLRRPGQR